MSQETKNEALLIINYGKEEEEVIKNKFHFEKTGTENLQRF